jgi:hypothetical protein
MTAEVQVQHDHSLSGDWAVCNLTKPPADLSLWASDILRIGNRLILGLLALSMERQGYPAARSPSGLSQPDSEVTGCPGIRDQIKSESLTRCYRNARPDVPGVRRASHDPVTSLPGIAKNRCLACLQITVRDHGKRARLLQDAAQDDASSQRTRVACPAVK